MITLILIAKFVYFVQFDSRKLNLFSINKQKASFSQRLSKNQKGVQTKVFGDAIIC